MVEDRSPRFRSAGAALRFYFRAAEVLSVKASNRLYLEGRIPATGDSPRQDLMLDYMTVAACLKDLNELQRWLLRELYRPSRFGEPAPSVTQAVRPAANSFRACAGPSRVSADCTATRSVCSRTGSWTRH
jgi:hypothetical protein